MRAFALALAVCLAAAPAWAKPRVTSINLCTDQLVLMLADDDQIVSLSSASLSPRASFRAERAAALGVPVNRASVEEALTMRPDVVLAGAWDTAQSAALARFGVRVENFGDPKDLDEAEAQLRRAGEILDQPARAAAAVAALQAARARAAAHRHRGETAVFYYSGGYSYGSGTLMDDVLATFHLVNLTARAGVEGVGRLDLEDLVASHPDVILTDDAMAKGAPRVATGVFDHPALKRALPGAEPVRFPLRYWVCGSDAAAALDFLAEHLR